VGVGRVEGEESTTWMLQGLIHAAITVVSMRQHDLGPPATRRSPVDHQYEPG
jgi:hypothetical protein